MSKKLRRLLAGDRLSRSDAAVALLLVPSGAAALLYQVTWFRLLGLSMGSTSASVSTVLVAFFLGLAAGSALAGRISRGDRTDLRRFLLFEAGIAAFATALLPVLLQLDHVLAAAGNLGTSALLKFLIAVGVLSLPTMCMGATFPLAAAYLARHGGGLGPRLGLLYALNTGGAVFGAACAGFVLIPNFGLHAAVAAGVALNASVVLAGWLVLRRVTMEGVERTLSVVPPTPGPVSPVRSGALVILAITGMASIAAEVGWTKYLALFTGATVYGFTTILIVFLTGITVGSWASRWLMPRLAAPGMWLAGGVAATGLAMHLSRAGLALLPDIQARIHGIGTPAAGELAIKAATAAAMLLPPTLLFGALFPLAMTLYCGSEAVGRGVGRAYALNTVAGIAGSIIAGFVVIPVFGTDLLLIGIATLLLLAPLAVQPLWVDALPRRGLVAASLVGVAAAALLLPRLDFATMIESVDYEFGHYGESRRTPKYIYVEEGKAGVISAVTYDGRLVFIQNDGLKESWIDTVDLNNRMLVESLLGFLPYLLHPNPKSAFVVGFGGGVTPRALTETDLETIRIVELEPAVVRAVRAARGGQPKSLRDPRVQLTFNDARNTLVVERKTYDIIASQPSHPWRAGAGNLFTREFFEIVHGRLREGGIFAQWVNLFNMDVSTLRSILKAYFEVFPHGCVFAFADTGDLVLIGSSAPLHLDFPRIEERLAHSNAELLARHGIRRARDLFQYFGLSRRTVLREVGDAPANTDLRLFSEFRLALLDEVPDDENPYDFIERHASFDVVDFLDPSRAADDLFAFGLDCLERQDFDRARLVYARLRKVAPAYAERLQARAAVALDETA